MSIKNILDTYLEAEEMAKELLNKDDLNKEQKIALISYVCIKLIELLPVDKANTYIGSLLLYYYPLNEIDGAPLKELIEGLENKDLNGLMENIQPYIELIDDLEKAE